MARRIACETLGLEQTLKRARERARVRDRERYDGGRVFIKLFEIENTRRENQK